MPPRDWAQVAACLTTEDYPAGTPILREGAVCRYLYFLEKGLLRYHVNRDGEDMTKFFTEPPYSFTAQRSFSRELPAEEAIETLQPSRIHRIGRADTYRLLALPSWSNFIRELIQDVQYLTEQLLIDSQNVPAEMCYPQLSEAGSPLLSQVPQKYLASYLGIAPQSLSRIRRRLSGGN